MKIAYYACYIGKELTKKYCQGKKYSLSGTLKVQGIARALLSVGHEVVIYSSGIPTCNRTINPFTEVEKYPEGKLVIKYAKILSYRKCTPINEFLLSMLIKKDLEAAYYDIFLYYNICIGAALSINRFKNSIKIIEYEDNILNKALAGDRNKFVWIKTKLYNYLMKRTDGIMAVCNGLMLQNLKYRILTPGVINEEVLKSVSNKKNYLRAEQPVRIILIGGTHYSKGSDLLIKALNYVKTPCEIEFYGNGVFFPAALDEITKLPSIHTVTNKGYMSHKELIKTLDERADILINTTRSMGVDAQAAGFPFKMMEYASTGRPIISSEIGKLDKDYNSHITYYEGENPKAIASAIEDVICHYDEKVTLALKLQKKVLNEYTIEGIGKKLSQFFKEIQINES